MQDEFVAVEHREAHFANVTKLEWFIGLECNFSCTYCAEFNRSGFAETEKIMRGVDLLKKRVGNRQIELLLGGGEPSIHPEVEKICKHIYSQGINLSMVTNGAKSPRLYTRLLRYVRHYTFSLHLEMPYERTMETIFAVHREIEEYRKRGEKRTVLVHLMMAAGHFDEAKEAMRRFDEAGIRYILRRIRPLFDKEDKPILPEKIKDRAVVQRDYARKDLSGKDWGYYTQEELDYMESMRGTMSKNSREFWKLKEGGIEMRESNANEILMRKDNRFEGWTCYVGIERLHIYPNGDVYRSTCKVGGKLGNIYEDFAFPDEPVVCDRKRCTCAWAVNLTKYKYPEFANVTRVEQIKQGTQPSQEPTV